MKNLVRGCAAVLLAGVIYAQEAGAPAFEIADVHGSAKTQFPFPRVLPPQGRHYEIRNAAMVDLIREAYGFDLDKIVGGPNWLELDRFDVRAKLPPESTPESQKLMLRTLLKDRFELKVHEDKRPVSTSVLTVGKKLQLKEADGTGETGCKPEASSGPPGEGTFRLNMNGVAITLGPGMVIHYVCRNMSMDAFAAGLRGMLGSDLGTNPVLNETGLKGAWNFDVKWSLQFFGPAMPGGGERIAFSDALEKQLGLKLEVRQLPSAVMVVDSVNRTPGANPPGVAEALPPVIAPKEFEVADVKPTDPSLRMPNFRMQPGGRLVVQGMPIRFLVVRAFNSNNNEQITGLPKWADSERFDITAKAPAGTMTSPMTDMETVAPMILSLLKDRFKMTYHEEERPVSAYTLVAGKPKMKKADPESRTYCRNASAPPPAPMGARMMTCQNITMAQFAERLLNIGPGLSWPVAEGTGLEGGWDFTLVFSMNPMMFNGPAAGPGRGGEGGSEAPSASDPSGVVTIFQAVEKQLGLKLESQKRSEKVIVIDHLEQKPTEN